MRLKVPKNINKIIEWEDISRISVPTLSHISYHKCVLHNKIEYKGCNDRGIPRGKQFFAVVIICTLDMLQLTGMIGHPRIDVFNDLINILAHAIINKYKIYSRYIL